MSKERGPQKTIKARRNRWHADRALAMWDCVIHNLAEIDHIKVKALEELPSDDEFVEKLSAAESLIGFIREVVGIPRNR